MLILHETNSRVPSNGQRNKTHVPLGTVISCPRWPPRSLGLDFTPCYKKAPLNGRDWTVDGTPFLIAQEYGWPGRTSIGLWSRFCKETKRKTWPPDHRLAPRAKPTRR